VGPARCFQGSREGIWDIRLTVFDTATHFWFEARMWGYWDTRLMVLIFAFVFLSFLTFASVGAYMDWPLIFFLFCLIFVTGAVASTVKGSVGVGGYQLRRVSRAQLRSPLSPLFWPVLGPPPILYI